MLGALFWGRGKEGHPHGLDPDLWRLQCWEHQPRELAPEGHQRATQQAQRPHGSSKPPSCPADTQQEAAMATGLCSDRSAQVSKELNFRLLMRIVFPKGRSQTPSAQSNALQQQTGLGIPQSQYSAVKVCQAKKKSVFFLSCSRTHWDTLNLFPLVMSDFRAIAEVYRTEISLQDR